MFSNHHQIYTHCEELGVIIGQYWKGNGFWGYVDCITESGYVVLDQVPMMRRRHSVHLSRLVTEGELVTPSVFRPYIQPKTGRTHIQVIAFDNYVSKDGKVRYRPHGELRRNFNIRSDV